MSTSSHVGADQLAAVRFVQWVTMAWMSVEVVIAAIAALRAHSIAILGFGGDSAIELLSAFVVLSRFTGTHLSEQRAAKITAVLLVLLAVFIVCASGLSLTGAWTAPKPSYLGMALLIAAAAVMPWLARRKRDLSRETGSSAMAADSVQSSMCAWLAWVALAGLGINAVFGISWADPAAALALIPIVLKEAGQAWNEKACHCC